MQSLLSATTLLSPSPRPQSIPPTSALLQPHDGAPLSYDTSLIPEKYLRAQKAEGAGGRGRNLVRSPPSTLLDAPTRAAMDMPNGYTARGQARAVRGADGGRDSVYENGHYDERDNPDPSRSEVTPLLSPSPRRASASRKSFLSPPLEPTFLGRTTSRPSSAGSNILRRLWVPGRASTPSKPLTRPTFPPPSLSTYSPLPFAPLSPRAKLTLFINQTISIALSTVFLAGVVAWALAVEIKQKLPQWIWPTKGETFPWDDDKYWRKEGRKVSKEPKDYARQVGMDIEDQVVETEDGYHLK